MSKIVQATIAPIKADKLRLGEDLLTQAKRIAIQVLEDVNSSPDVVVLAKAVLHLSGLDL